MLDNFSSLYEKFLGMGSVYDNIETRKTKKCTARTQENFEKLTKLMTDNPSTSQRITAVKRIGIH